ncbi:hypothetical protein WCLE_009810 [Wolbachia endosymbiont of Cimex lectularius]|nr:hypothetical protein WCLE_009810 [Wolbachia endosymbiont of Cimex lectularius]
MRCLTISKRPLKIAICNNVYFIVLTNLLARARAHTINKWFSLKFFCFHSSYVILCSFFNTSFIYSNIPLNLPKCTERSISFHSSNVKVITTFSY